uniref:Uncharacterized protein n=1 Tax=Triticum urartu TaxID=4572 RepID=A0A8R7QW70_TRIUA
MGAEYVPEKPGLDAGDPPSSAPPPSAAVFEKFGFKEPPPPHLPRFPGPPLLPPRARRRRMQAHPKCHEEERGQMQLRRMKIAEVKQMCDKPDLVEI